VKRVLLVHPYLDGSGGGSAVAAWTIHALHDEMSVKLLTYISVDCHVINEIFGCDLHPDRFETVVARSPLSDALERLPVNGASLRAADLARRARKLHARERFDAIISTCNELDLGGRNAIVYVHYPYGFASSPSEQMDWRHGIPVLPKLYRETSNWLTGTSIARLRRQTFLANSSFVAEKIQEAHGVQARVVHPPVPGGFPDVSWADRRRAIVGIGRLHPIKQWQAAVEIVDRVRDAGRPLELTLIGTPDGDGYGRALDRLAADRPWFRILRRLSRERLVQEVAQHRYGIHPMPGEHFGIAVAELLRAGCLPFVHRSGGPLEILGGENDLTFESPAEAALRILRVWDHPARESELRKSMRARAGLFTEQHFIREIREQVRNVIET